MVSGVAVDVQSGHKTSRLGTRALVATANCFAKLVSNFYSSAATLSRPEDDSNYASREFELW